MVRTEVKIHSKNIISNKMKKIIFDTQVPDAIWNITVKCHWHIYTIVGTAQDYIYTWKIVYISSSPTNDQKVLETIPAAANSHWVLQVLFLNPTRQRSRSYLQTRPSWHSSNMLSSSLSRPQPESKGIHTFQNTNMSTKNVHKIPVGQY